MPLSILNPRENPQKTSNSLDNFRVEETNVDDTLETIVISCIQYPTIFSEKSVSTQKLKSMLYTILLLRN